MFTDTDPVTLELLADDHCSARFLLVGGGGEYGGEGAGGGGAGSGFLEYSSVPLTETTTVQIRVGDQLEPSTVTIDGITLEAAPGEGGTSDRGGNGWSGGGAASCSCNGGSGGGDGAGDDSGAEE